MNIYDEPKVDCHSHLFDPGRFPYAADAGYAPGDHEISTAPQLMRLFDAYGVRNAVIVGPFSGYGADNACLLDVVRQGCGRFKGIAIVPNDIELAELERLKSAGIVGAVINTMAMGVPHYLGAEGLLTKLAELGMFLQVQYQGDEILPLLPLLKRSKVHLLIDHCGRPLPEQGINQPGFKALLGLGQSGRAHVKLSGQFRFSRACYPYADTWPYVRALVDAFTLDACLWGSDWPFVRAAERMDYGVLLQLVEQQFPAMAERRKLLWETPCRLFGFGN